MNVSACNWGDWKQLRNDCSGFLLWRFFGNERWEDFVQVPDAISDKTKCDRFNHKILGDVTLGKYAWDVLHLCYCKGNHVFCLYRLVACSFLETNQKRFQEAETHFENAAAIFIVM